MAKAKKNRNQKSAAKSIRLGPIKILPAWIACLLAAGIPVSLLEANPTGGNVAAGTAQINGGAGTLTVNQASDRTIINWQNFSIGRGELAKFVQPSATSAALNRVLGSNLSEIYGALQANGQVYLINPNGIVIGRTGVVNTAGFVASTLDVTNDEFLQGGSVKFVGDVNSQASVKNFGKITALDGDVILIAQNVENAGKIHAPNGTAALAAGTEVLLKPGGDQKIFIKPSLSGSVKNSGVIKAAAAELKAAGGNEYALAINNSGVVRATGVENRGGKIWLVSKQGAVSNTGTLQARKSGGKGGFIETSGTKVQTPGTIDAGKGGTWLLDPYNITVTIGADSINNSGGPNFTPLGGDSQIGADLIVKQLDAGTDVILDTGGLGSPGEQAGNITVNAPIIKSAANGSSLTLNAANSIFITQSIDLSTGGNVNFNATAGDVNFGMGSARTGEVNIMAGGSISMVAGRSIAGTVATLNTAGGNITFNSDRNQDNDGNIRMFRVSVTSNGGNITLGGGLDPLSTESPGERVGAWDHGAGMHLEKSKFVSGAGNISLRAKGQLLGAHLDTNTQIESTSGNIDILGTSVNGGLNGGGVTLTSGAKVRTVTGDITITGNRGEAGINIIESLVESRGSGANAGSIALNGVGDTTSYGGIGIRIYAYNPATMVKSKDGDVTINATAGDARGGRNYALLLLHGGTIALTGKANLTVNTVGAGSTPDFEVQLGMEEAARSLEKRGLLTPGLISIVRNEDRDFVIGGTTATGNITIHSDNIDWGKDIFRWVDAKLLKDSRNGAPLLYFQSKGVLTISPNGVGKTIGVAGNDGAFSVVKGELNGIKPGFERIVIGNTAAGTLTTNAYAFNTRVSLISAGSVVLNGAISGAGTGDTVVLSGGKFINNAGSKAVKTGDGRFLIYSLSPSVDTFGGLKSGQQALYGRSFADSPPETITETGNRYLFSKSPGVLKVKGTVTASKTYGDVYTPPAAVAGVQYGLTGFMDASLYGNVFIQDSISNIGLTGAPTFSSAGDAAEANASSKPYAFSWDNGTLANTVGYVFGTPSGGTLTVNPRAILIKSNSGQGKIYGTDDPASAGLAYSLAGGSLALSQTLTGTMGRASGESVGQYAFTQGTVAVDDGRGGANYKITFNGSTRPFSISPASLTGTIENQSKVYGDSDPALAGIPVLLGGLVQRTVTDLNGRMTTLDDSAAVGTSLAKLTRNAGEDAGNYPYTAATFYALSGSSAGNYSRPVFAGSPVLEITRRPITVAAGGGLSNYGDVPNYPGLSLLDGTLAFSDSLASIGLSDDFSVTNTTAVGDYVTHVLGKSLNYDLTTLNGAWTVGKRELIITANAAGKHYGEMDPILTYSIGGLGLVNGDRLAGMITRAPGQDIGVYEIRRGILSASGNYNLLFNGAEFTISP